MNGTYILLGLLGVGLGYLIWEDRTARPNDNEWLRALRELMERQRTKERQARSRRGAETLKRIRREYERSFKTFSDEQLENVLTLPEATPTAKELAHKELWRREGNFDPVPGVWRAHDPRR